MGRKLSIRERRLARKITRQAWIASGGDSEAAKASLESRFAEAGISPGMILLFIKLAIMLIDFWYSKGIRIPELEPQVGEPFDAEIPDEGGQGSGLWGKPPRRRVRGSYEASDYAPRGQFGPREAGSVASNTLLFSGVTAISWQMENLAEQYAPGIPTGMAGIGSWGAQIAIYLILKTLVSVVRQHGHSLVRDVTAWIWSQIFAGMWDGFKRHIASWLPFGRWRRRRRPWIDPDAPDEDEDQPRPRRRRLIDRFFDRLFPPIER